MFGWIRLHRRIQGHWIFKSPDYLRAFMIILFNVNHQEAKVEIHGELIDCGRGQSVKSLAGWTKMFGKGWTVQKTRTFLKLLEKDEIINTVGLSKTTRLTVCNYERYQGGQQTVGENVTNNQQTLNKHLTTNNNNIRINKNEEEKLNAQTREVFFDDKNKEKAYPTFPLTEMEKEWMDDLMSGKLD